MNNGSRRRGRRKYKIRYDRIAAVAIVLIVLILLLSSCVKGCSKKDDKDKKKDPPQSSVVDELTTDPNAPPASTPDSQNTDPNTPSQPGVTGTVSDSTVKSMEYSQINNGDLLLVNSLYPYKFQEGDASITTVFDHRNDCYTTSDNIISLDQNTITQLNALMEAYFNATSNKDLRIIGGYRTIEVQNDKYNNGKSKFQGGYSDYHTGRSFDIGIFPQGQNSNYYNAEGTYAWFAQNAASYGFIERYPSGKDSVTGEEARTYTYRYVGVPHAVYMKENNLCLEEYIEQIKSFSSSNPLTITSGTATYQVYYVAANANNVTDVPVPSNYSYTISGNNSDGFIVTLTIA